MPHYRLYSARMSSRFRPSVCGIISGMKKPHAIDVVAENLRRLRERYPELSTQKVLASRSGVGEGTIGRITRKEAACGIDSLEAIAGAFGLEAWQMLIPGLDPDSPPSLGTSQTEQAILKTVQVLQAQLDALKKPR